VYIPSPYSRILYVHVSCVKCHVGILKDKEFLITALYCRNRDNLSTLLYASNPSAPHLAIWFLYSIEAELELEVA
jgi:hypothetical protein